MMDHRVPKSAEEIFAELLAEYQRPLPAEVAAYHLRDQIHWLRTMIDRQRLYEAKAACEEESARQSELWWSLSEEQQKTVTDWLKEHRPLGITRVAIYQTLCFHWGWKFFGPAAPHPVPVAETAAPEKHVPTEEEEEAINEEVNEILPLAWTGADPDA